MYLVKPINDLICYYIQKLKFDSDSLTEKRPAMHYNKKTIEMLGNENTRKAKTMRVSQHRMLDYKNVLKVSF